MLSSHFGCCFKLSTHEHVNSGQSAAVIERYQYKTVAQCTLFRIVSRAASTKFGIAGCV